MSKKLKKSKENLIKNELKFEEIYKIFRPRIIRYLIRLVGGNEAEDLTQEVFIKINRSLKNFKGESKLSTWIYRIATNAAIDKMRNPSFRLKVSKSEITPLKKNEEEDIWTGQVSSSIEELLIKKEMRECFLEFVNKLELNYRTVFVLSDLIGMPDKRISEILELNLSTIKIRLHRARLILKKEMEIHCGLTLDPRNHIYWEGKRP